MHGIWLKILLHGKSFQGWLGSRVVSMLESGAEGPGFKSQSRHCRVTVFGKLFTVFHTHCTSVHQATKLIAALLKVTVVTAGWRKVIARFMIHVICRLTAKNWVQLWNPTLGNRVWATFTFLKVFSNVFQCFDSVDWAAGRASGL